MRANTEERETVATTETRYYEDHPIRHDYSGGFADFVQERNRAQVPLVIKRYETCTACPIQRVSFINVIKWEVISRYYVGRNKHVVIGRKSKADALREHFMETTNLEEVDYDRIA